ncbi:Fic family protein [Hymenobacter sp. BT186]|uniref:Fic family protein n=1 Tax=Hymenobacter telluris TaxID=2816474 RepID=A0A939JDB9_9BACT|nr:Fic family protein [Hymenobacter telluris]MBO0359245.1 Fic family protein [Hymenobacter telluris]MBW3375271.1 Fic family protein [Hymenobacter norwichensis]
MSLFAEVDLLKKELDELRPLSPDQEARILQKFRLDWNYNSNAIEGNSLTLGETRSLLLHGLTAAGKPIRDHLDIKGHNEAVLWLEDIVRDERPLTEQFIRGMHEVLLGEGYDVPAQTPDGQPTRKHIQPGRYKSGPNNVQTATGEIFYFASPEETPGKMTDLVDWYRQKTEQATLHPVALAAEFHYRFVRIHPFDDGNGRMSRLLMNLILMRSGYPMTVIKATDRNRYLAALAEADAGEIEPFFRFISENVVSSLHLMIRAAKDESIDEPDDLDKKLALLKKQVLTRNESIKLLWDETYQEDKAYNLLIEIWLDDLILQSEKFDDFFINKSYVGYITSAVSKPSTIQENNDLTSFKKKLEYATTSRNDTIEFISFSKRWYHFRQLSNGFDAGILVVFEFKLDHFKVRAAIVTDYETTTLSSFWSEGVFSSIYLDSYNHEEIHNINYNIITKLYEYIKTKIIEDDEVVK